MTATVVLVHGAWHGGWCWEPVVDLLAAQGIPAIALDLPGHGTSSAPRTDLHGHGNAIRDTIDTIDAIDGPVILVGHSYGGAAITDAGTPALVPGFVARLVPEGAASFDPQPRAVA